MLLNGSETADDPNGYLKEEKNLKELLDEFNTNFAAWQAAYNPETGEGNYSKMEESFDAARSCLNEMQDVLAIYSDYALQSLPMRSENLPNNPLIPWESLTIC